ncbi:MAG: hypothetical protein EZS28_025454, partial [Streblomastix strix]
MALANDFLIERKFYHQLKLFLQQCATFWIGLRHQKDGSAKLGRICLKLLLCPASEAHSEREFSNLRRKLCLLRVSQELQRLLREMQINSIARRIEQIKHQKAVNRRFSLNAAQKTLTVSRELLEKPKVANDKNKSLNVAHKTPTTTESQTQRLDAQTDGNVLVSSKLSIPAARDFQSQSEIHDERDTLPQKSKAIAKTRLSIDFPTFRPHGAEFYTLFVQPYFPTFRPHGAEFYTL